MFRNRYIKRTVDGSDARACFICYKPTISVLTNETPNTDFFFICDTHLSDPGFARLDPEYELQEKKRKEEQAEIDQLKADWEARKANQVNKEKVEEKNSEKTPQAQPPSSTTPPPSSRPTYELNKGIFKLRLNAKRQKVQEKKTKSLLEMPGLFPSAPKHKPT